MLQQQCVACNLMISNSGSSDGSCTCGHVFTKKKLIGGKRFSEYRAELYSRLENKKQRMLMRKNRQIYAGIQEKTTFERQLWSDERIERHKFPRVEKINKGNIGQQTKVTFARFNSKVTGKPLNNAPVGKKPRLDRSQATVLESLLRRFPSALAEINKRLTSQNLLWFSLNTPRRVRSEQLPIIQHQE
ncbi:uncharacterized protein [Acropora muricata]|uniref:uncharacterized protein n=1 Tax=Acropora muricata TaxID=159855 RepID=UPI0010FCD640|nr:uncharacterized protein LOC114960261 isoform X1 [Acropora millepora]